MLRDPISNGLPAIHALHLIDFCQHWGVPERELLAGLGVRREDLSEPDVVLDVSRAEQLVDRARCLTREPGLGMYLGTRMCAAAHGFVGFAAQSSATLGDAIRVAVRYAPTRTTALALRLEVSGETASIVVDECVNFGSARDVILLALLIGLWQIGNVLLGRRCSDSIIRVTFPEPGYFPRFRNVGPRFCFDQPTNRLSFNAALLDVPLPSADASSLHLARGRCEQLLLAAQEPSRFTDRARRLVLRSAGGARSLEELAAIINISSRTLRRRLANEGDSYSTVLDNERHARAIDLLKSVDVSIKEIAHRLGYSDVPNFTRAFRRWTGQTPAAFRRTVASFSPSELPAPAP